MSWKYVKYYFKHMKSSNTWILYRCSESMCPFVNQRVWWKAQYKCTGTGMYIWFGNFKLKLILRCRPTFEYIHLINVRHCVLIALKKALIEQEDLVYGCSYILLLLASLISYYVACLKNPGYLGQKHSKLVRCKFHQSKCWNF